MSVLPLVANYARVRREFQEVRKFTMRARCVCISHACRVATFYATTKCQYEITHIPSLRETMRIRADARARAGDVGGNECRVRGNRVVRYPAPRVFQNLAEAATFTGLTVDGGPFDVNPGRGGRDSISVRGTDSMGGHHATGSEARSMAR